MLKWFIFLILGLCVGADSDKPKSRMDILCALSEEYYYGFTNCMIDRSPPLYKEKIDNVYKCVDKFYENNGKLDSLMSYTCDEVGDDYNVYSCISDTEQLLGSGTDEDIKQFDEGVDYCFDTWTNKA